MCDDSATATGFNSVRGSAGGFTLEATRSGISLSDIDVFVMDCESGRVGSVLIAPSSAPCTGGLLFVFKVDVPLNVGACGHGFSLSVRRYNDVWDSGRVIVGARLRGVLTVNSGIECYCCWCCCC